MKEPNVQLKKLKTFEGMEGMGINVDLWINGVNCCFVLDSGDGGGIDFRLHDYDNPIIKANLQLLDDYIATLPPFDFQGYELKYNRAVYIGEMIDNMQQAKVDARNEKKLKKKSETCIVFGREEDNNYRFLNLKRPLSTFPIDVLQRHTDYIVKQYCVDGIHILNTNLTELGITF